MKKQNLLITLAAATAVVSTLAISSRFAYGKKAVAEGPVEYSVTFSKDSEYAGGSWFETTESGNKVEMATNDYYATQDDHGAGKFFHKALDNNNYFIYTTFHEGSFSISNIKSVSFDFEILNEVEDENNSFCIGFYTGSSYMGISNSVYNPTSNQVYTPADGDYYRSGESYNCVVIHPYGKIELEIYSITITYECEPNQAA